MTAVATIKQTAAPYNKKFAVKGSPYVFSTVKTLVNTSSEKESLAVSKKLLEHLKGVESEISHDSFDSKFYDKVYETTQKIVDVTTDYLEKFDKLAQKEGSEAFVDDISTKKLISTLEKIKSKSSFISGYYKLAIEMHKIKGEMDKNAHKMTFAELIDEITNN